MCSFFCANGGAFEEIRICKAMVRYATTFKSISLERLTVDRPDLSRVPFHKFRFQQCPGPSDYFKFKGFNYGLNGVTKCAHLAIFENSHFVRFRKKSLFWETLIVDTRYFLRYHSVRFPF